MIKIITDSGSDILQEECDKVRVLPLHVSFGEEHYRDGVDLLHETFYEKLIETDVLPKTSQISPYEFMEAYRQELDADASAGEADPCYHAFLQVIRYLPERLYRGRGI